MNEHYEDHLNKEIVRLTDKVRELEAYKEKAQWLFDQIRFETSGQPFICGVIDNGDKFKMPDVFLICPAYGSDAIYRYRRED